MRSISDTITRLQRFRPRLLDSDEGATDNKLIELQDFGSNPGELRGFLRLPLGLAPASPLVVVLHGVHANSAWL